MSGNVIGMKASEIIRALGGATELSKKIGAGRSAISNWPRDGIPGRYWPALARVAADNRQTEAITLEVIEAHERESPRQADPDGLADKQGAVA